MSLTYSLKISLFANQRGQWFEFSLLAPGCALDNAEKVSASFWSSVTRSLVPRSELGPSEWSGRWWRRGVWETNENVGRRSGCLGLESRSSGRVHTPRPSPVPLTRSCPALSLECSVTEPEACPSDRAGGRQADTLSGQGPPSPTRAKSRGVKPWAMAGSEPPFCTALHCLMALSALHGDSVKSTDLS